MAGALDGIRVLDLCIILAGPTCGRTLAEYGADVIKIDVEHRKPRLTPWIDVGRGKRSICLDLSKPEGLDVFYRMVETADVVMEGFRKGVSTRMGIGYEQLRKLNPRIVYVSINAFGQEGPWSLRPGFDQNAQAATGLQTRIGGIDGKPAPPAYTVNDYGTGLMAAYGVMLALLERRQTGEGQRIETALSYTASTVSSPFLIDYEGFERNELEGPYVRGRSALDRLYQTSDGWIFLAAEENWNELIELADFARLGTMPEFASDESRRENSKRLSEGIEAIFREKSTDEWIGLLKPAGVTAVPNATMPDLFEDEYAREHGLIVTEEVGDYGTFDHGGVAPQLSRTPAKVGSVPMLGGDTDAVLAEIGYTENEIATLRSKGVISPREGVPLE